MCRVPAGPGAGAKRSDPPARVTCPMTRQVAGPRSTKVTCSPAWGATWYVRVRVLPVPVTRAWMAAAGSPSALASPVTAGEPGCAVTVQVPADGFLIPMNVVLLCGWRTSAKPESANVFVSSGVTSFSPCGPVSVTFGASSAPRTRTVANGSPAGSVKLLLPPACAARARAVYGPTSHPSR